MSNIAHIIKRQGHTEPYDERKLYASIYAICLSVRAAPADAELIANDVCRDINEWLSDKPEVTSHDVRNQAAKQLERYNPDAAYLYSHHHKLD
jgi:transcriptional regulator NrdR family protein